MLDAKLCNSSATCYSINDVSTIINNGILLIKNGSAWKDNNSKYLAKHNNLNNQYVPNINIALNAVGYDSTCREYFYLVGGGKAYSHTTTPNYYVYDPKGSSSQKWWRSSGTYRYDTPAALFNNATWTKNSSFCYRRGSHVGSGNYKIMRLYLIK